MLLIEKQNLMNSHIEGTMCQAQTHLESTSNRLLTSNSILSPKTAQFTPPFNVQVWASENCQTRDERQVPRIHKEKNPS